MTIAISITTDTTKHTGEKEVICSLDISSLRKLTIEEYDKLWSTLDQLRYSSFMCPDRP